MFKEWLGEKKVFGKSAQLPQWALLQLVFVLGMARMKRQKVQVENQLKISSDPNLSQSRSPYYLYYLLIYFVSPLSQKRSKIRRSYLLSLSFSKLDYQDQGLRAQPTSEKKIDALLGGKRSQITQNREHVQEAHVEDSVWSPGLLAWLGNLTSQLRRPVYSLFLIHYFHLQRDMGLREHSFFLEEIHPQVPYIMIIRNDRNLRGHLLCSGIKPLGYEELLPGNYPQVTQKIERIRGG